MVYNNVACEALGQRFYFRAHDGKFAKDWLVLLRWRRLLSFRDVAGGAGLDMLDRPVFLSNGLLVERVNPQVAIHLLELIVCRHGSVEPRPSRGFEHHFLCHLAVLMHLVGNILAAQVCQAARPDVHRCWRGPTSHHVIGVVITHIAADSHCVLLLSSFFVLFCYLITNLIFQTN